MKVKKSKIITFAVILTAAVLFIAAGAVCLGVTPKNSVIIPEDSSTVTRIARSYTDDGYYVGTDSGLVIKYKADGSVGYSLKLEAAIRSISTDIRSDKVLVIDDNYDLFSLKDTGEELEKTFLKRISGGFQSIAYDDDYVYFAVPLNRNTQLLKFGKDDLGGEPVAKGLLYNCIRLRGGEGYVYEFELTVSSTIVGMYALSDGLYVITGEGFYHRIDKDFSHNSWEYSAENLDKYNAEIDGDGRVTVPEDSYDKNLYRTTSGGIEAGAVTLDEENGLFYIATKDGNLVSIEKKYFTERSNPVKEVSLPNLPATGGITFSRENGKVYVAYQNISEVTVFNAKMLDRAYGANVAFYISGMVVPASGDTLLTICAGNDKSRPDAKELLVSDLNGLGGKGLFTVLSVVFLAIGAVCGIASIFAGLIAFKPGYSARFYRVVRGMCKTWVTYLIIVLSLAMLVLFCYYPGISSMILSLFDYTRDNPTMHFNNFENYIEIFSASENLIALRNMLIFLVSDIFTALVPPCLFAFCLAFMRSKKFSTVARVVLFMPTVLPGIATLLIWKTGIYGVDGVLNLVIKMFRGEAGFVPVQFFQDHGIISLILMGFPFVGSYLIFYGALMNVPSSYYEAAELDGCPLLKRIFTIDLPMIAAQMKYVFILSFIQSVQNFGRVLMTTDGAFDTQIPIVSMYHKLQEGDYGMSSAYATLMFIVLIAVTILNMKIQTEDSGL